jgi:hypothetical protein
MDNPSRKVTEEMVDRLLELVFKEDQETIRVLITNLLKDLVKIDEASDDSKWQET